MGYLRKFTLRAAQNAVRNPRVASKAVPFAESLILAARGFSYDPRRNGEAELISRALGAMPSGQFVFFDVGANVGDWTALVLGALGERPHEGHLFEPTPSTYQMLRERYSDSSSLQLSQSALSSSNLDREFLDIAPGSGQNTLVTASLTMRKRGSLRTVTTRTGDDYCSEKSVARISLLKIDTEGWDYEVLLGFTELLSQRRVDIVQFEYGYSSGEAGFLMSDAFRLLEGHGYSVGPVRPGGVEFRSFRKTDNDFMSGPNYAAALPQHVHHLARADSTVRV
jgi:FkbM family methyltransferase